MDRELPVDYINEICSIDRRTQEEEDEDYKTAEESEEETWMRDSGVLNYVEEEEGEKTKEEIDFGRGLLATLTPNQRATVKKKFKEYQATRKRKKLKSRADVRNIFSLHKSEKLGLKEDEGNRTISEFFGRGSSEFVDQDFDDQRMRCVDHRTGKPSLNFMRSGHKQGYKLTAWNSASSLESTVNGIAGLSYNVRSSIREGGNLTTKKPDESDNKNKTTHPPNAMLEVSFQKAASEDLGELPMIPMILESKAGTTRIGDLSSEDMKKIQSLALIELTGLFDCHDIKYRRKHGKRKVKDDVVFGASLSTLLESDQRKHSHLKIPLIFQWIISHLEKNGLKEEGLLRLGGSIQKIAVVKEEVERHYFSNPAGAERAIRHCSIHETATLLKQMIRQLPEPLLTYKYIDGFLQVPKISDLEQQLKALNLLIILLPDVHRDTLEELLRFLAAVVDAESHNRMSLHNVAMIIAPNLFTRILHKSNGKNDMAAEVTIAAHTCHVAKLLMKYQHILWVIPPLLIHQIRLWREDGRKKANKEKKYGSRNNSRYNNSAAIKQKSHSINTTEGFITLKVNAPQVECCIDIIIDDKLTVGQTVQKFTRTLARFIHELDSNKVPSKGSHFHHRESEDMSCDDEDTPRSYTEAQESKNTCLFVTKKCHGQDHHNLYEVGGNIGERRVDRNAKMLEVYSQNPLAEWEIRCS